MQKAWSKTINMFKYSRRANRRIGFHGIDEILKPYGKYVPMVYILIYIKLFKTNTKIYIDMTFVHTSTLLCKQHMFLACEYGCVTVNGIF